MLRPCLIPIAAAFLAAPPLSAQDLASICTTATHPPVGAWAEYQYTGGQQAGSTMRVAAVGSEARGDTTMLWIELAMRAPSPGGDSGVNATIPVIAKLLVPAWGSGMTRPRASVMKYGSAPAMQMPADQGAGPGGEGPDLLDNCRASQIVGWEQVVAPDGSYRALHVRSAAGDEDVWLAPGLAFGVVKDSSGGSGEASGVILSRHGMGATSQITEQPRPYDPAILMQLFAPKPKGP